MGAAVGCATPNVILFLESPNYFTPEGQFTLPQLQLLIVSLHPGAREWMSVIYQFWRTQPCRCRLRGSTNTTGQHESAVPLPGEPSGTQTPGLTVLKETMHCKQDVASIRMRFCGRQHNLIEGKHPLQTSSNT